MDPSSHWGVGMNMETLFQDVRYGLRMLAKNPGFTSAAVLTLALGIGANTAIFSLIDALMLRWLPVRNPQELVQLKLGARDPGESVSYPIVLALADQKEIFASVAGFTGFPFSVGASGSEVRVPGGVVTGGYYETLGLTPVTGRLLTPDDDRSGAPLVAAIRERVPALTCRDQLWVLGAGIRAQSRNRGPDTSDERSSGHDHWRESSGLRWRKRRIDSRHHDIGSRIGAGRSRGRTVTRAGEFLAACARKAQATCFDCGSTSTSGDSLASDSRTAYFFALARFTEKSSRRRNVPIEPRRHGLDLPAGDVSKTALDIDGRGVISTPHRVRQCCQSAAGSGVGEAE